MTSIALFHKEKEKKNISHIWDGFSHEFKVFRVDSAKPASGPVGQPNEQDNCAAQLVWSLKKEQSKRRYGYGTSLWNSMRSRLYMMNPNRSIKVYAKQIQHLRQRLESTNADISACWCPLKYPNLIFRLATTQIQKPLLHFEHAPFPGFFVADTEGVNMGNSLSRDYQDYKLQKSDGDEAIEVFKSSIEERTPQKKAIASRMQIRSEENVEENFIYCPLQVDEDTQLVNYGGWCNTVSRFIENIYTASRFLPAKWSVLIREHPSSRRSYTQKLLNLADSKFCLDNTGSSLEKVKRCRAIATINSSVGLHGFLFDKNVITLGRAMWSFGDMTTEARCPVHLSELFANPDVLSYSNQQRHAFLNYLFENEFLPRPKLINGSARLCPKAKSILQRKVTEAKNLAP